MNRRAVAIRVIGDPEIGGALFNALNEKIATSYYSLDPVMGVRAANGFKDWKSLLKGIPKR